MNAAAGLTLRSPASVLLPVQAERLPVSNPSAKITSVLPGVLVDVGVLEGVDVEVAVAVGVIVGVFVDVGDGPAVGVDVTVEVAVGV
jgi:hypothetical protein